MVLTASEAIVLQSITLLLECMSLFGDNKTYTCIEGENNMALTVSHRNGSYCNHEMQSM